MELRPQELLDRGFLDGALFPSEDMYEDVSTREYREQAQAEYQEQLRVWQGQMRAYNEAMGRTAAPQQQALPPPSAQAVRGPDPAAAGAASSSGRAAASPPAPPSTAAAAPAAAQPGSNVRFDEFLSGPQGGRAKEAMRAGGDGRSRRSSRPGELRWGSAEDVRLRPGSRRPSDFDEDRL